MRTKWTIRGFLAVTSASILSALLIAQPAAADRLSRLSEVKRGVVSDLSVINLAAKYNGVSFYRPSNRVVVAMRDAEDRLRLMVWDVSNNGSLSLLGDAATEGAVKTVSVARVSSSRVATAVRDSRDMLRIIVWDISSDGRTITRRGTGTSVRVKEVQVTGEAEFAPGGPTGSRVRRAGRLFTAARDGSGKLHVADWAVSEGGDVSRVESKTYGTVSDIDVATGHIGHHFAAAAIRESGDRLKLISFQSPAREGVDRGGVGQGAEVSLVRTNGHDFGGDTVYTVTASPGPTGVRTGQFGQHRLLVDAGLLKVIRWDKEPRPDGPNALLAADFDRKHAFELGGSDGLATAADIAHVLGTAGIDSNVVTAHAGFETYRKALARDRGKPRLHVIAWSDELKKTADATLGGKYTHVEMVPIRPQEGAGGASRFFTALRGERGELKLVVWRLAP